MPLVSMRQLLDHAAENGYGIPAFNVNNLEQVQAVMTAAAEVGAPVILQRARRGFFAEASLASERYHCDGVCRTDCDLLAFPLPALCRT